MDESFEQTQALHLEEEEEDDLGDTDREHTQVTVYNIIQHYIFVFHSRIRKVLSEGVQM